MNARRIRPAAAGAAMAALALAIGGCSQEAEQPSAKASIDQPVQPEPVSTRVVEPETRPAAPAAENMAQAQENEAPPAPPVSREAQMLDDAAASGMTARLPRSTETSSEAGNGNRDDTH